MTKPGPVRAWILPARDVPCAVVIRRGPSQVFHVLKWNTETDAVESGTWFSGKMYPLRSDLSPDGRWLVYLAMHQGKTFNAVSCAPSMTHIARWYTYGTWFGGGLWRSSTELAMNGDRGGGEYVGESSIEFREATPHCDEVRRRVTLTLLDPHGFSEDEGVLYQRLERDGWKWATPGGIDEQRVRSRADRSAQASFWHRPSEKHPTLRLTQLPYSSRGRQFAFSLDEKPAVLAEGVQWACYDSLGSLLVSRRGCLERWDLSSLRASKACFVFDLNLLKPRFGPGV